MKTKGWFPIISVFLFVFILTLSDKGFAEEPAAKERTKPAEPSDIVEHKPDIYMEVISTPERAGGQSEDQDFEDDDFDEDIGDEEEEIYDPLEPFNRLMWSFNEKLYDHALEPVARGYSKAVPEPMRIAIKNFFSNISEPVALVSSIVQLNKDKVDRSLGRFLINSTLGIGGLFDPAAKIFKLKKVHEDFDQALAYHNMPKGPFIMLPILGPSTTRGLVGNTLHIFLSPEYIFGIDVLSATGFRTEEIVNEISLNLEQKEELDSFALDPYSSVKDFYMQRRKVLENE